MFDTGFQRVSAAELIRNFGHWQGQARTAPVVITHRGRDSHILSRYVPDFGSGEDAAAASGSMPAIFDEIAESVLVVDEAMKVIEVNRAACDFIGQPGSAVVGQPLVRILPAIDHDFVHRYLMRTIDIGEHFAADIRSHMHDDGWIRFKTVRVGTGAAIIFRDITEETRAYNLADAKQGIVDALEIDGSVGYARISVREMVERANSVLTSLLGVSEEALRRVKFSSVIPPSHRARFHDALEQVFRNSRSARIDSRLLVRSGMEIPVILSIVELRGIHASEGAVVLISRAPEPVLAS